MADLKYDDEKQAPAAGGYVRDVDSDEEGVTFDKLIAEGMLTLRLNSSCVLTAF
jgi:hypothetical protein